MEQMETKLSDFDRHIDYIRSFLSLTAQNQTVVNLLQWMLSHPVVRSRQLSVALYSLTPRMTWELQSKCGATDFDSMQELPDTLIAHHDQGQEYSWGYFDPLNSLMDDSFEQNFRQLGDVLALGLGNEHVIDGLMFFAVDEPFDVKSDAEMLSFMRIAAEFIYHQHRGMQLVSTFDVRSENQSLQIKSQSEDATESGDVELRLVSSATSSFNSNQAIDSFALTKRQKIILYLIGQGATNEEIAQRLHLSIGTIRVETSRLYDRLGARNRQQAATFAHLLNAK